MIILGYQIKLVNKSHTSSNHFQSHIHFNQYYLNVYYNFDCVLKVPVSVDSLPDLKYHPVRVGISDAFVIFRWDPVRPIVYRFFFIYSQINITKKSVINGSAVVFYPLPS